jgi:two-component system LytT family sensor kinase
MPGEIAIASAAVLILAIAAAVVVVRTRRVVATPTERAVHAALHTASLAAHALRHGLDADSAQRAAPILRQLTGADASVRRTPGPRPVRPRDVDGRCARRGRDRRG